MLGWLDVDNVNGNGMERTGSPESSMRKTQRPAMGAGSFDFRRSFVDFMLPRVAYVCVLLNAYQFV